MANKHFKFFEVSPTGRLVGPYSGHVWTAGRHGPTGVKRRLHMCAVGWHVWKNEREARSRARLLSYGRPTVLFEAKGLGRYVDGSDKRAFAQVRLGGIVAVYQGERKVNDERAKAILKRVRYQ